MKNRRLLLVPLLVLMSVGMFAPTAQATSVTVDMIDNAYTDPVITMDFLTETAQWDNGGGNTHTATQDGPWKLWNTGDIPSAGIVGESMNWAGTFSYHCKYHPGSMKGKVRVPLDMSGMDVLMANADAPAGLKYELQMRKGTHPFKRIFFGKASVHNLGSPSTGEYDLRSRVVDAKSDKATGWSPKFHFAIAG